MKAKRIVPIVVGGILSAGAAAAAYCEIRRLKQKVSVQEEIIKTSDQLIKEQEAMFDLLAEENKKNIEEIEGLEQIIAIKDSEIIALQKDKVSGLQNLREDVAPPKPDVNPSLLPEESSDGSAKPKKAEKKQQEYVFQYDSDFNVVGKYESFADAARSIGLKSQTSIGKVANGKEASAGGYFWSKGVSPLKKFPVKWEITAKTMKNKKRVN